MRTALLPKEHGAYGQMAFPLITALVVCGATAPALFTVVAIVTGFLAHEPALVLLGMRGARARRELARDARRWMLVLGAATCTAGALAVLTAPRDVLWSFAVPLLPAVLLAGAIAMLGSGQGATALAGLTELTGEVEKLAADRSTLIHVNHS